MKIVFNLFLILVAAALGLAIGFVFRAKPKEIDVLPGSITSTESAARPLGKYLRPVTPLTYDASPLATKLERDLSMSSGVTRWLYWLDALEKATTNDFPRLIRLAQGNSTAMRFIAARWVEVDPRHMFDTIVAASNANTDFPANELAQILFQEWPNRDPKGVIAALNSAKQFRGSSSWRTQVSGAIFNNDVELGLRLMSDWNVDHYIPSMSGVRKWAAADPRHAAEVTYQNQIASLSREMMKTIAKEWAGTDPLAALDFANAKTGELGTVLASSALKEWADRDLKAAADWLAGTDARTRARLGSAFVESWAKQDVLSALEWCALNLSGSSLAQAVGGVFKGAAQKDLAGAQDLVAQMNPSKARAEAAAAIAHWAFPDSFSEKPVPPDTVAWLKQLDPHSLKRALDEVHWQWVSSDAKGFADLLKRLNAEEVSRHIFDNVARNLARINPEEAVAWAAELPAQRSLEVGSAAFTEWRRSQPEAAIQWLNKLRPDDPRRAWRASP